MKTVKGNLDEPEARCNLHRSDTELMQAEAVALPG